MSESPKTVTLTDRQFQILLECAHLVDHYELVDEEEGMILFNQDPAPREEIKELIEFLQKFDD